MRRIVMTAGALVAALGCGGTSDPMVEPSGPDAVWVEDFEAMSDPNGDLPLLPPPITSEETAELRESFQWTDTAPVAETNPAGRPALFYALVFLRNQAELESMRLMGLYLDAMPIFDEELVRYDGLAGVLQFEGDGEGSFAYTVLPGEVYNQLRDIALVGEPAFDSIILVDSPVSEAVLSDGSLSYEFLAGRGFTYGFSDEELGTAPAERGADVGRATEALGGRLQRVVQRVARRVVNTVRRGFAEVREFFAGSRRFSVRIGVNTNSVFAFGSGRFLESPLRRAWGANQGREITIPGVQVQVRNNMNINTGRLDENGYLEMRVPKGRLYSLSILLKNHAAVVTSGGFWETRIALFRRNNYDDRTSWIHFAGALSDSRVHVLAQMTGAQRFVNTVWGYSPRPAIVSRGPLNRALDGATAAAPCLSFFGLGTQSAGHGRGAAVPFSALGRFTDIDILMAGDDANSRVTPTHEYGHFIMCNVLYEEKRRDFARAWGEVIQDSASGGGGEAATIAEGWADFFSNQVAGGLEKFGLSFTAGERPSGTEDFICNAAANHLLAPCMEDNIGGVAGAFPDGQFFPGLPTTSNDGKTARVATILTDMVDGHNGTGDHHHNGAVWVFDRAGDITGLGWVPHAGDESVVTSGRGLVDLIGIWSDRSNRLLNAHFFNAAALVMDETSTPEEVCELFAIHSPSGMCDGASLVDLPALRRGVVPSQPLGLTVFVTHPVATAPSRALLLWSDISPLATGFVTEVRDGGTVVDAGTVGYGRNQTYMVPALPFDRLIDFEVRTRTDEQDSEPAIVSRRTPAEPVTVVRGTALRGAAEIDWDATQATEYIVRMRTLSTGAVRTVDRGVAGPVVVRGLSETTSYEFTIIAVNGAGEETAYPSPTISVMPLPPNALYVSRSLGNDSFPLVGSAVQPYQSIGAAVAAVPGRGTDVIRIHGGVYDAEAAPLRISNDLTLEGGYTVDGAGVWTPGAASTELHVSMTGADDGVVSTARFNDDRPRNTRAGLVVDDAAQVLIERLDVRGIGTSLTAVCGVVVDVRGASLVYREGLIAGDPPPPGGCRIGVQARSAIGLDHELVLENAEVHAADYSGASPAAGATTSGLAVSRTATLRVIESSISGGRGAFSMIGEPRTTNGVVVDGVRTVRVSRSYLRSLAAPVGYQLTSGVQAAFDGAARTDIFIDNSFLHTVAGATENRTVRVRSAGTDPLSRLRLYHSTIAVGTDWQNITVSAGTAASGLETTGSISATTLVGNLLVFAAGRGWGTTRLHEASNLDLSLGVDDFRDNAYAFANITAILDGFLFYDFVGDFAGFATTEIQLNEPRVFDHFDTRIVDASNNFALLSTPGAGGSRRAPFLSSDGEPLSLDATGTPRAAPTDTVILLRDGALPHMFGDPVADINVDINGAVRSVSPGIGAWIL